jgi:hypothetical protein
MKTLRDYDGAEGIAKFAEIEPYVSEIIKDSENIKIAEMTNFQLGAKALELHADACEGIFKAFGGAPASPQGKVAAMATVLLDILTDKDMIDFFILSGKIMESK